MIPIKPKIKIFGGGVLLLLLISSMVSAEEIKIIVTDAEGKNVGRDVDLELQYNGESIGSYLFNPTQDSYMILDVGHTGTYKIIAKAEIDLERECDSIECHNNCN